jgi:hypothetical protein
MVFLGLEVGAQSGGEERRGRTNEPEMFLYHSTKDIYAGGQLATASFSVSGGAAVVR